MKIRSCFTLGFWIEKSSLPFEENRRAKSAAASRVRTLGYAAKIEDHRIDLTVRVATSAAMELGKAVLRGSAPPADKRDVGIERVSARKGMASPSSFPRWAELVRDAPGDSRRTMPSERRLAAALSHPPRRIEEICLQRLESLREILFA